MNNELVSIIMPCYNVEKYIAKAIESVQNQSYGNWELIIVNDFTPDNSVKIAEEYKKNDDRIIVVNNKYEPHNVSNVMNTGLDLAKGKYVTRLDSDDYLDPKKIEKQVRFLEKNKDIILCSTNLYFTLENGKVNQKRKPLVLKKDFNYKFLYLFENPLPAAPCMFIRDIIEKHNLRFDSKYKSAEDFDFISRYLAYGDYALIDEPLYYYRLLNTGLTGTSGSITNINSIEICARNIKLFLDLKAPDYHKYITKYFEVDSQVKTPEMPYSDIISLAMWSNELLEAFFKKYNIKNKKIYVDYLNDAIIHYISQYNENYVFINCNIFSRTIYYYKLYGMKATFKKIIEKLCFWRKK